MPEWDELFKKKENRWEEPHEVVIHFAQELKTRGARRVLDLGCGAGRHVVYLAREGFEVCGTDVSPRGLQYTRDWLNQEGLQADLQLSDMTVIPYPDNHFDAMISTYVIHHNTVDNIRRCVAEIHRTLAVGGRAMLTVQGKHGSRYGRGKEIEPDTYVHNRGAEAGVPHHFFGEPELRDLFAAFATVEITPLEWNEIKGRRCYRHSHYIVKAEK